MKPTTSCLALTGEASRLLGQIARLETQLALVMAAPARWWRQKLYQALLPYAPRPPPCARACMIPPILPELNVFLCARQLDSFQTTYSPVSGSHTTRVSNHEVDRLEKV